MSSIVVFTSWQRHCHSHKNFKKNVMSLDSPEFKMFQNTNILQDLKTCGLFKFENRLLDFELEQANRPQVNRY